MTEDIEFIVKNPLKEKPPGPRGLTSEFSQTFQEGRANKEEHSQPILAASIILIPKPHDDNRKLCVHIP